MTAIFETRSQVVSCSSMNYTEVMYYYPIRVIKAIITVSY